MSQQNKLFEKAAEIASRVEIYLPSENPIGVDVFWPAFERMRRDGAIVFLKLDGLRTRNVYTAIASGGHLPKDEVLRIDAARIEEAAAYIIAEYGERCWPPIG